MTQDKPVTSLQSITSLWSRQSIGTKFGIAISFIVLVVIAGLTFVTVSREKRTFQDELTGNAEQILNVLAYTLREPLYLSDINELQDIADIVQANDDIVVVKIYSETGTLLIDTTSNIVSFSQAPDVLGVLITQLEIDNQYINDQPDVLVVGRPIMVGRQLIGGLVIEFSTLSLQQNLTEMYQQTFGIAVISIVLAILLSQLFVNRILLPLRELSTVTELFATGDYSHTVRVQSEDEIGQLGTTFNRMASAVQKRDNEQIDQLEKQLVEVQKARDVAERSDQVKSSFLASMSHELRTPLNSIINFSKFLARGMMGEVNEQQQTTLQEISTYSEHLLSLINDVLDMSKIE